MYFRPFRLLKVFTLCLCVFLLVYECHQFFTRPAVLPETAREIEQPEPTRRSAEGNVEEISYTLEPFFLALPNFPDDEARNWFYGSSYYKYHSKSCPDGSCEGQGVLFNDTKEHRSVSVFLVKDGLYRNEDCGYNYGAEAARLTFTRPEEATVVFEKAILYPVPDGWSFQHFLDGIGPKLAHSRSYLQKYPEAKVVILKGIRFDRSVREIWEMLGASEAQRLVHYESHMKVGAHLLINPCKTPGIHPRLWQEAREMYWTISGVRNASRETQRANLIYIQRTSTNAMNGARLILNEQPFIAILRAYAEKHSLNYVQYDHSQDKEHIRKRIELFYRARVIIGVHSGALSNMNFSPSGTTVIEIMPYRPETSVLPMTCSMFKPEDIKACAGYILYTQARLLNQSYWILPTAVNSAGNMEVDMTRVQKLMNQITL